MHKYRLIILSAALFLLTGCSQTPQPVDITLPETAAILEETPPVDGIERLTPDGPVSSYLDGFSIPETKPAPEYLRSGVEHAVVAQLQQRLMELGFMDNDEPTEYFGSVTESAVKTFQRQNELAQDGIVGSSTWDAIMNPEAKYYAASKGVSGDDIARIQNRLYELGYLAATDMVSGYFGDSTEAAIIKLQNLNGLTPDGTIGRQTLNLLYSEDIKPNMLIYGEKSEVVLAAQNRLKALGYMTSLPDGAYGNDTALAIKQFQSRNDLVVDGYLGPSTRDVLNSSSAIPMGLMLGEQGEVVTKIQQLLNKYGYLSSSNITGYYGEKTEAAVKSFQRSNGLSADGAVGTLTMAKLTGSSASKAASGSSSSGSSSSVQGSGVSALLSVAKSKLGKPYVWGAKGPNSFDCSGFVYWCLNQVGVRQSYITSSGWRSVGKYTKITSFSNLKAGDIIVVSGHVGIVAGGGTVIDASSSNGKVVHRSLSSWWSRNFICGWRIYG